MFGKLSIAALCGVASALVLVASVRGGGLVLALSYLSFTALPIVFVGFGWGWLSSLVAGAAAALVLLLFPSPAAAGLHLLTIGIPYTVAIYLLLLYREAIGPDGKPVLEWYPPGRVLAVISLLAGCVGTVAIFSTAANIDDLQARIREFVGQFAATLAEQGVNFTGGKAQQPTDKQLDDFSRVMTRSYGALIATAWMFMACFNLWLGARIAQASGKLQRPWPDLSWMVLPRETPLAFIVAIGLSFLPGMVGLIAASFVSVIFFAYMIIGLAILHNITRGKGARPFILGATYAALLLFMPTPFILAIVGIAEPVSPLRRAFGSPAVNDD